MPSLAPVFSVPSRSKQCFPYSALSTIPGKTFLLRPCSARRGWICLRPSWHVCGRCTRGAIFSLPFVTVPRRWTMISDASCGFAHGWSHGGRPASRRRHCCSVYSETGYPEYVQGLPGGAQRLVNLHALHERAARFDGFTQGGLTRFLRFVESLQAEEGDLGEAPVLGEGDDVVRIMSIHKSKGLQFPVVIVADLGKRFNISDRVGTVLYDGHLGIARSGRIPNSDCVPRPWRTRR